MPEILAPAGNWECICAAVSGGANAVYFGLDRFNARMRAGNFTREDLPSLIPFLHRQGMKAYVTMNVLIFTAEMREAWEYLCELAQAGVDGVIVQDVGLATLFRRIASSMKLPLHISTQMTVTSPEAVRFVERTLQPEQIVLARELSLKEIALCAEEATVPTEVFVHGALCVSYSGQCLTSESLGQRSANRGECAQACRMPYRLEVNGRIVSLGDRRYLMSPKDLCALDRVPELMKAGVGSFKIEGRLKSPEYVYAVSAAYSKAAQAAECGEPLSAETHRSLLYDMQMTFSRGFWTGWLDGPNHPALTHGRFGKKRGAYAGRLSAVGQGWVELEALPPFPISPGDGFVIDRGEDRNEEQGGRIWKQNGTRLYFHRNASHIDWHAVCPGNLLWKTDDPALNARLAHAWQNRSKPGRKIDLVIHGGEGTPLTVSCEGITIKSQMPLQKALHRPLTPNVFREQFGRLGNTSFVLGECTVRTDDDIMLPLSELNRMRRELVEQLPVRPQREKRFENLPVVTFEKNGAETICPCLYVLCRTAGQAYALAGNPHIKRIYLDLPKPDDLASCVRQLRETAQGKEIFIATLRIHKHAESRYLRLIEKAEPDGVLVRNLGAAEYFCDKELRLVGDFSLNVTNPYSVRFWLEQHFESLTASYDLNIEQLLNLLQSGAAPYLEMTLHQHMPLFHMEHCVFCSFLSKGTYYGNCGQPCERNRVRVIDRTGMRHVLKSDEGCRNTLFNGKAQSGARFVSQMIRAGLNRYRIEFLEETPDEAQNIANLYAKLISSEISADYLLNRLNPLDRIGVTEGTLICGK